MSDRELTSAEGGERGNSFKVKLLGQVIKDPTASTYPLVCFGAVEWMAEKPSELRVRQMLQKEPECC